MKPLYLVIESFGPFRGRQTIDFSALGNRQLFLIVGDTGSGKTTIFDAMCAALYGKTSVGRLPEHMKCLSADPEALCRLEFSFQVGKRSFRIERIPEQNRLSRRGARITHQAHAATLWETTDGPDHVLATKVLTVLEHIESILGLSAEQFCQVVLLPQGRFEKMLKAPASEREKVMQVLFQTDRYLAIQEQLAMDARQAETEVREALSLRDQTLQAVGCATPAELVQRQQTALAEMTQAQAERAELDPMATQARLALEQGREIQRKIEERAAAEQSYAELHQQEPAIQADREVIERARRAVHIESTDGLLTEAIREAQEALQSLENKRRLRDDACREKEHADTQRDLEEKNMPEHDRVHGEITRLESLETIVAELAHLQEEVRSAGIGLDTQRFNLLTAEQALGATSNELEQQKERYAEQKQLAGTLEERRHAIQAALEAMERDQQAQMLREAIHDLKKKLESACKRQEAADRSRKKAHGEYTRAQEKWIEAQAAQLAKALAPGIPCPVCGSSEHPRPAQPSHQDIDPPMLDQLKAISDKTERAFEQIQAEVHDGEKALSHATGRAQILSEGTGPLNTALVGDPAEFRKQFDKAEAAQTALPDQAVHITKLKEAESQQKQDCLERRKMVLDAEARWATAKAKLEQRETDIPPQLRDPATLRHRLAEARLKLQSLKQTLKNAQSAAALAREKFARQSEAVLGADEAHQKAVLQAKELREKLEREIAAEGFASETDYRAAKRRREAMKALEEKVARFENELASLHGRRLRAIAAAQDLEAPDLNVLENQMHELFGRLQQTDTRIGALSTTQNAMATSLQRLEELQLELNQRESRAMALSRLANIATGLEPRNPGFHRFVLAERLDEVLLAANRRLGPMSGDRYRLERVHEEENRRVSPGLNLEVLDGYSGKCRPVDTLSGGESFLAALSLALGLADVVQQHAGGVKLDTVFVDEGFGSLDPNALELAMRCLEDLRQTGRLVGVISHVAELKERIRDAQLRVTHTHGVSEAQFVVS